MKIKTVVQPICVTSLSLLRTKVLTQLQPSMVKTSLRLRHRIMVSPSISRASGRSKVSSFFLRKPSHVLTPVNLITNRGPSVFQIGLLRVTLLNPLRVRGAVNISIETGWVNRLNGPRRILVTLVKHKFLISVFRRRRPSWFSRGKVPLVTG